MNNNGNLSAIIGESLFERPSSEDVHRWSESFSSLIASKYGIFLFRTFLMSEFSHENLDFWLAVQEFKKIDNPQEMAIKAKMVYKHFIASNATNQVNLDYETRSTIQKWIKLKNFHQEMFDRAERRIHYLMEHDSYARFRESEFLTIAEKLFNVD